MERRIQAMKGGMISQKKNQYQKNPHQEALISASGSPDVLPPGPDGAGVAVAVAPTFSATG